MNDNRRRFLGRAVAAAAALKAASATGQTLSAAASRGSAAEGAASPAALAAVLPRPLAQLTAGQAAAVKLDGFVRNFLPGVTQLRLRANLVENPMAANLDRARSIATTILTPFESQFGEFSFDGRTLRYDGSPFPALSMVVKVVVARGW